MKKILVIQLKQIGDVLLSSPVCNTLKKNFPDSQVDYIIYDYAYGLIKNNPNIDNIICITKKERESKKEFFKFLLKLSKTKYDICINIQGKIEGFLITLFSFAKVRIGWNKKGWKLVNNHNIGGKNSNVFDGVESTIDQRLVILNYFGDLKYQKEVKIWLEDSEKNFIKEKMIKKGVDFSKPILAFGVNSRREYKIWPKEYYIELINYYLKNYDVNIILHNSPNERKYAEEVKEKTITPEKVFEDIETKNIRDLACLFAHVDIYIGNEGGPRHIVEAVDKPTFTINYLHGNKKNWIPNEGYKHRVIELKDILDMSDKEYEEYKQNSDSVKESYKLKPNYVIEKLDKMLTELKIIKK